MSNDIHKHDEEQDEHEYKWRLTDDSVETNIHEAEEEEDGQISEYHPTEKGLKRSRVVLVSLTVSVGDHSEYFA